MVKPEIKGLSQPTGLQASSVAVASLTGLTDHSHVNNNGREDSSLAKSADIKTNNPNNPSTDTTTPINKTTNKTKHIAPSFNINAEKLLNYPNNPNSSDKPDDPDLPELSSAGSGSTAVHPKTGIGLDGEAHRRDGQVHGLRELTLSNPIYPYP